MFIDIENLSNGPTKPTASVEEAAFSTPLSLSINKSIQPQQLQHQDPALLVVNKKSPIIDQVQHVQIKYLKPPLSPPPGDIIVHQEPHIQLPPMEPLVIVERPSSPDVAHSPSPSSPEIIVIREEPPEPLPNIPEVHITVPGKVLPPPPRQVIVERLAQVPPPPPDVLHEKWLRDETPLRRRVVFVPAPTLKPLMPEKNILIQWDTPQVRIREQVTHLGVHEVDPRAYAQLHGQKLVEGGGGVAKHAVPILYGDVEFLREVDLKAHGLAEYEEQVRGVERSGHLSMMSMPDIPMTHSSEIHIEEDQAPIFADWSKRMVKAISNDSGLSTPVYEKVAPGSTENSTERDFVTAAKQRHASLGNLMI